MSGWITLTFDPIDGETYAKRFYDDPEDYYDQSVPLPEGFERPHHALLRRLVQYDRIPVAGDDVHEVYAKVSYGPGPDPETILEETADLWNRAVILRANDTGSTGSAVLYEYDDGGLVAVDEFAEGQCDCCGGRTGREAAAYMLLEHHIDVLADFRPTPRRRVESESDVDALAGESE